MSLSLIWEKMIQAGNYVRRVVGLPGETVQIVDGRLYINDTPLEFEYNSEYIEDPGLWCRAGDPWK